MLCRNPDDTAGAETGLDAGFRAIIERADDGIVITDAAGRCRYANPRGAEVTGYPREELVGMTFFQLVPPAEAARLNERLRRRLAGEAVPSRYETVVLRKDGVAVDLDMAVTRTIWEEEPCTVAVFRDITERKRNDAELQELRQHLEQLVDERTVELTRINRQLEQEVTEHRRTEELLRASEARFRTVFEKTMTGMSLTGPDGRFIAVNEALCRILGYSAEELQATGFAAVTYPEDLAISKECVRCLLAGEQATYHFEKRYLNKNGAVVWTDVSTILLRDPAGQPVHFITHIHDITGRKQAGERVRELNRELEATVDKLSAANQELESFSYSVSHDLRAPLRAIDGFSRMLLEEHAAGLTAEGQRLLKIVRDNTRTMSTLIDDLLAFSRLSRQPLNKQPVQPEALVRAVVDDLRAARENRQVEIVIGDLPACPADPALLRQVWVNLIDNALKFTRRREKAVIEIGSRPDGPVYYVKDNGVGFDMAYVGKLFAVFQRLHRVEEYEGTGIGLAIVQRIIRRHGGRVWAEGATEQGATFCFTLAGGEVQNLPDSSTD